MSCKVMTLRGGAIHTADSPEEHRPGAAGPLRRLPYFAQVTLVAVVYFAAATFALPFALSPGFATAVWPPSGIALAGLLLPGFISVLVAPGLLLNALEGERKRPGAFNRARAKRGTRIHLAISGCFLLHRRILGAANEAPRKYAGRSSVAMDNCA